MIYYAIMLLSCVAAVPTNFTYWRTELPNQVWNNLVVNQINSSTDAKLYWQRTSEFTPYNSVTKKMLLRPQASTKETYHAAWWTRIENIPPLRADCTYRRLRLYWNIEYPVAEDFNRSQQYSGSIAKFGFSKDSSTELELGGIVAGVGTGIDNSSYRFPDCDFTYQHGIMGLEDMGNMCSCDYSRPRCAFFRRRDIPSTRTSSYENTFTVGIDPVTSLMKPLELYLTMSGPPAAKNIVGLKQDAFASLAFPFNISAARWLNQNGSSPAPFLYIHSQAANVTVNALWMDITDECETQPPTTTTITTYPPGVIIITGPPKTTTTTTTSVAATTTADSVSTATTTVDNTTTQLQSQSGPVNSTNTISESETLAPSVIIPPAELDEFGVVNVIIIAVVIILCLCVVSGLCIFRERISESRCFGKLYFGFPGGRYIFCCCRPSTKIDRSDGAIPFGNVPTYLRDQDPAARKPSTVSLEYSVLPAMDEMPSHPPSPATVQTHLGDGYAAIPYHASTTKRRHQQQTVKERRQYDGVGGSQASRNLYDVVKPRFEDVADISSSESGNASPPHGGRGIYEDVHAPLN